MKSKYDFAPRSFSTDSLDTTLAYPHYTDMDTWRHGRVIFGQKQKTELDAYDDRLMQWDWNSAERARAIVESRGVKHNTARWHQEWLCAYHERPVILKYIIGGVNWSNGYAYYFYGYNYAPPEDK